MSAAARSLLTYRHRWYVAHAVRTGAQRFAKFADVSGLQIAVTGQKIIPTSGNVVPPATSKPGGFHIACVYQGLRPWVRA